METCHKRVHLQSPNLGTGHKGANTSQISGNRLNAEDDWGKAHTAAHVASVSHTEPKLSGTIWLIRWEYPYW